MAKKPISQKRAEREKQENQTLQRVFNVFLLGIAAECYLFIVYRNYVMGTAASLLVWHNVLRWAAILGVVLLLAGGVTAYVKRGEPKLRRGMTLAAVIVAALALWRFLPRSLGDVLNGDPGAVTSMAALADYLEAHGVPSA